MSFLLFHTLWLESKLTGDLKEMKGADAGEKLMYGVHLLIFIVERKMWGPDLSLEGLERTETT